MARCCIAPPTRADSRRFQLEPRFAGIREAIEASDEFVALRRSAGLSPAPHPGREPYEATAEERDRGWFARRRVRKAEELSCQLSDDRRSL